MQRRDRNIAVIGIIALVLVLAPIHPLGWLLWLFADSEIQRGIAAIAPDVHHDVTIQVRKDGREWTETVSVACVTTIGGGNPLRASRTRTEFPEFTVLALDDVVLVVPIVSVCGRSFDLRSGTPVVTDSATGPTWVAPADDLGFAVQLSSERVRAANREIQVRDHYRRLRDHTNWGAVMGTVDGQSVNVSDRVSGMEFTRIQRTDFANPIEDLPSGAIEDQCLAYGPRDSDISYLRSCVTSVWHAFEGRGEPDEDVRRFCERFDVRQQCTATNPADCGAGERLYRRTGEAEFSGLVGRTSSPGFPIRACYGMVRTTRGFSLLTLDSPSLFVVLEPEYLSRIGRIRQYLED